MKIGFIVNPIAGMGGKVGLKGTDNKLDKALELGAEPVAPERVREFLKALREEMKSFSKENADFITAPAEMGGLYLTEAGLKYELVSEETFEYEDGIPKTTSAHTKKYAKKMLSTDIIVFAGGDGTARDIYSVVGTKLPILGIPCGVKVYSGVFGTTPEASAELLVDFIKGTTIIEEAEVMDIDETAMQRDILKTKLTGYAKVPYVQMLLPGSKDISSADEAEEQGEVAEAFVEEMQDGLYIMGGGTTVDKIAELLKVDNTLLGVDVIEKKEGKATLLKKDVNEQDLLKILSKWQGKKAIVVSPLGGQGFIFGRGIPQISAKVLEQFTEKEIFIVATRTKMHTCSLRVDVSPEMDERFHGKYLQVLTGFREHKLVKVE